MLNKIGFFQLDNLINNRVPFLFFNMSGNTLSSWYTSLNKMHVDTYEILAEPQQVLAELESRQAPQDYAIVLLCQNGDQSMKTYADLTKKAYTNVYVVDGGYQQMMTDKDQI